MRGLGKQPHFSSGKLVQVKLHNPELARLTGAPLTVVNLSNQSESVIFLEDSGQLVHDTMFAITETVP